METPLSVLCLEDEEIFGRIIKRSTSDFSIDVATNGTLAAKYIVEEKRKYVAIVLDGQFPLLEE